MDQMSYQVFHKTDIGDYPCFYSVVRGAAADIFSSPHLLNLTLYQLHSSLKSTFAILNPAGIIEFCHMLLLLCKSQ